jgi:hypothetical protein
LPTRLHAASAIAGKRLRRLRSRHGARTGKGCSLNESTALAGAAASPVVRNRMLPGRHPTLDAAFARIRLATAADHAGITQLMAQAPMHGELAIATARGSDALALYRLQRGTVECLVHHENLGMCAFAVRDGFIDGEKVRVGFLSDLRMHGKHPDRRLFPRLYGRLFHDVATRQRCDHWLTSILATNEKAVSALVATSDKRKDQPRYTLLARYDMAAVQLVVPPVLLKRRVPRVADVAVRTATADDVPHIAQLLHSDHKHRAFGWCFDDGEFEHRLQHWPGFSLDNTYVACRPDGTLAGVCTAWDPAAVSRFKVVHLRGKMKWLTRASRWLSPLVGATPLPDVSSHYRYPTLANLSIVNDDPTVFRAMLRAVALKLHGKGLHFFAFPLYENDPLAPAIQDFIVQKTKFHLYRVTATDAADAPLPRGRPGFEMALV